MYVPFPFQGKGQKGRTKLMYMFNVQFLEHVIIVSNTIQMSSIFVSLLPDPVSFPFPDSGFRIPDSVFSIISVVVDFSERQRLKVS